MRIFLSLRFNIGLLCALILASAAGTFLPQSTEDPARVEEFIAVHPSLGPLFRLLGLFDLYHSPWFLALWAVIVLDIALCKLSSLPGPASDETAEDLEEAARSRPLSGRWTVPDQAKAFAAATDLLASLGYRVRRLATGTMPMASSAELHGLQAWGSLVAHASLVAILAGGLLKGLFGFHEFVAAAEGGTAPVTGRPGWIIGVTDFSVERYEDTGANKRFTTRLAVYEHGRLVEEKDIRVNDPLSVPGLTFYQDSWGATGMWRSASLAWPDRELELSKDGPMADPESGARFSADLYAADFGITADGRPDNLTTEPRNPALRVTESPRKGQARTWWLLEREPAAAFIEDASGVLHEAPPPAFRLASVDPVLFSGVQAVHDPGYPLVLGGSLAWLAGMVLNFYLHRRRILVVALAQPGREARLCVGALSSRGPAAFKEDFDRLIARMREVSS
ncbi:MAG: cytochrome c biogenesis protein ResB [Elusimicrobia bacterium]|nr:cytochrome c biogenesis protein ResB [Elusimicrobiota bacterium]